MAKIAILLIRGIIRTRPDARKTLELLNLKNQHNLVVVDDNDITKGMLKQIHNLVTWGPISEETITKLAPRLAKNKKTYLLHPPRGGFERGGIKKPYNLGGVLGPRQSMDELIVKMIPETVAAKN